MTNLVSGRPSFKMLKIMEYKIFRLPSVSIEATTELNRLAKLGWIVICAVTDFILLLGREKE